MFVIVEIWPVAAQYRESFRKFSTNMDDFAAQLHSHLSNLVEYSSCIFTVVKVHDLWFCVGYRFALTQASLTAQCNRRPLGLFVALILLRKNSTVIKQ